MTNKRMLKDLTPEHTRRHQGRRDLHPEILAAYDYVDKVSWTSDYPDQLTWHAWALREAFLAGCSYAGRPPSDERAEHDAEMADAARFRWLDEVEQHNAAHNRPPSGGPS